MVVLDESKENFILDIPYVEEVEAKLREEERRRTGRYLAVSVVLFVVGLGFYHGISNAASKMSALISAAMIMFLYLLWLLYASQRRKHQLKRNDLNVEKEVSNVLQKLNNIKKQNPLSGPQGSYVYSSSEDDMGNRFVKNDAKVKNEKGLKKHASAEYCNDSFENEKQTTEELATKSSRGSDILIRTYSIA